MAGFLLNANLKLVAPTNTTQVLRQIQNQLKGLSVPVNLTVNGNGLQNLQNQLKNVTGGIQSTRRGVAAATTEIERFGQQSANSVRRFFAFTVATVAVYKLTGAISKGTSEVVAFNREMNRLEQVTGLSQSSLKGIETEVTRLATSLGTSSNKLIEVASTLAQAGLSAKDTRIALDALAKTTVSATFGNIKDTTEASIAIMQQFGKEASDLSTILSSVNKVSAAFASESEDITKAVKLTGASFAAAGDDFHKFQALFVSVRQTTRGSAESIATGLRTISARLQRPRTQSFLKSLGIELLDAKGQFVGVYRSVEILSAALKDLPRTDPRFAKIAEELGGYRQLDKIIPLIEQFGIAQKAYNISVAGGNSLTQDAATYQKSFAAQLNKVNEEFQALIRKFADDSGVKQFVYILLEMTKAAISLVKAITPLSGLIAGLGASRLFGLGSRGPSPIRQYFNGLKSPSGFGFNQGGVVPGSGNGDTVPAMLEPGEFVLNKKAVHRIGIGKLKMANAKKFAKGGLVGDSSASVFDFDSELEKAVKKIEALGVSFDKLGLKVGKNITGVPNISAVGTNAPAGSLINGVFKRGGIGNSAIELNKSLIKDVDSLFDVLVHEVGHAIDNAAGEIKTKSKGKYASNEPGLFQDVAKEYSDKHLKSYPNLSPSQKRYYGSAPEGFAYNFENVVKQMVRGKSNGLGAHGTEIFAEIQKLGLGTNNPSPQPLPVYGPPRPPLFGPKPLPVYGPPKPPFTLTPGTRNNLPPLPTPLPLPFNRGSNGGGPPRGPLNGPPVQGPPRPPYGPPRPPNLPPKPPVGGGGGNNPPPPVPPAKNSPTDVLKQNPLILAGILISAAQFARDLANGDEKLNAFIDTIVQLSSKVIFLSTALSIANKSIGKVNFGPFQSLKYAQGNALRNARRNLPLVKEVDNAGNPLPRDVIAANIRNRNTLARNQAFQARNRFRNVQTGAVIGAAIVGDIGDRVATNGSREIQAGNFGAGRAQSVLGGTLSSAGTGAALGSAFGVAGAAAGAAAGALYGFTTSLLSSKKEIDDVKVGQAIDRFAKKIQRFASGGSGINSFGGDFVRSFQTLGVQYNKGDAAQKQNIKASIGANASSIQDIFTQIAKTSKSFDDFDAKTHGVIDTFAELSDIPFSHLKEQLTNTIIASRKSQIAFDKNAIAVADTTVKLRSYNNVIRALNSVNQSFEQFDSRLSSLSAAIEGTSAEFKAVDVKTLFEQVGGGKVENLSRFRDVIGNIRQTIGPTANPVIQDANVSAQIIKDLPAKLLATRAQDPLGKGGDFTERLIRGFGEIPDFAKHALEAAISDLKGEGDDEQKLLNSIKNDLYGSVEQLSKTLQIPIQHLGEFATAIEQQSDRTQRALNLYGQALQKATDLALQRIDKEQEISNIINDVVNQGRPRPLASLQAAEAAKAVTIGGSNNVGELAAKLNAAQASIADFDKQLQAAALDAAETATLQTGRAAADREAQNAAKALHFLAFESKTLANIQQHIAEEQKKVSFNKGVLDTAAFGSNEEKKKLSETIAFTELAKKNGIEAVPQNKRRDVQQFLEESQQFEELDKLRKNAGLKAGVKADVVGNLNKNTSPELNALLGKLTEEGNKQIAAIDALSNNVKANAGEIQNSIIAANDKFLADLKKIFEEQVNATIKAEELAKATAAKEIDQKLNDIATLKGAAGLLPGTKIDQNNSKDIAGILADATEKRNLVEQRDRVQADAARKIEFLQRNFTGDTAKLNRDREAVGVEALKKREELNKKIFQSDSNGRLPQDADALNDIISKLTKGLDALNGQTEQQLIDKRNSLTKKSSGGFVPGSGNTDSVPAVLTPGEFVFTKQQVKKIGAQKLRSLSAAPNRATFSSAKPFSGGTNISTGAGVDGNNNENLLQLGRDLKQFSTDSKALVEALRSFPHQLEITMNGKIEVIFNGMEAFKMMDAKFKGMVVEEIKKGLDKYHEDNWSDAGPRK